MNTKKRIRNHVLIGGLIGFIATAIGFYFYAQVFHKYSMKFIERLIIEEGMLGEIIAYSAMPNLLAFFVFIKRKEDYKARGVMLATMLIAIVVFISFFI